MLSGLDYVQLGRWLYISLGIDKARKTHIYEIRLPGVVLDYMFILRKPSRLLYSDEKKLKRVR